MEGCRGGRASELARCHVAARSRFVGAKLPASSVYSILSARERGFRVGPHRSRTGERCWKLECRWLTHLLRVQYLRHCCRPAPWWSSTHPPHPCTVFVELVRRDFKSGRARESVVTSERVISSWPASSVYSMPSKPRRDESNPGERKVSTVHHEPVSPAYSISPVPACEFRVLSGEHCWELMSERLAHLCDFIKNICDHTGGCCWKLS